MTETTFDVLRELCRGEIIDAKYGTPDLRMHEENPLIEALPRRLRKNEVMEMLEQWPEHRSIDCKAPAHIRIDNLENLGRFFMPLPRHVCMEQEVSGMIRSGYIDRNPLSNHFYNRIKAKAEQVNHHLERQTTRVCTTLSGLLTGISGSGKTYSLERILKKTLPQVIIHKNYMGTEFYHQQLVWLKVNCPSSGTANALCKKLFQTVDVILDTQYEQKYCRPHPTMTNMAPGFARVALMHSLGLAVIDELHNLKAGKSGGREQLLNFIVELESMGVPVLLVANGKPRDILGTGFRQLRRSTGLLEPHWHRMMENSSDWKQFSAALWRYQYLKSVQPLTDELRAELYYWTQGIADFAVKVYKNLQKELIHEEDGEQITRRKLAKVAARVLAIDAPVLKAIREKNLEVIKNNDDLDLADVCEEDILGSELPPEELERLDKCSNNSASKK